MRRILYNMQYDVARVSAYRLNAATKDVKSTDIAALHRVDRPWQPSGFDDQTAHLVEMPPDYSMVLTSARSIDAAIPTQDFHRHQIGPVILTPWPIVRPSAHLLPLWVQLD